MEKQVFVIPDDVKDKNIDEIGFSSKVVEYLHNNGYKTVREVIEKQKNIPKEILTNIKAKLIFNIDV